MSLVINSSPPLLLSVSFVYLHKANGARRTMITTLKRPKRFIWNNLEKFLKRNRTPPPRSSATPAIHFLFLRISFFSIDPATFCITSKDAIIQIELLNETLNSPAVVLTSLRCGTNRIKKVEFENEGKEKETNPLPRYNFKFLTQF